MSKDNIYGLTKHSDLIRQVAQEEGVSIALATRMYRGFISGIVDALNSGNEVTLPCFAAFRLVDLPARKGRNPRTGEVIEIPEKTVVRVHRRKGLADVTKFLS